MSEVFDHSLFVQTHAIMLELLDNDATDATLQTALDTMETSLKTQFAKEEKAMRAVEFGPYEAHKKDHDQALERLSARIAQWHESSDRKALLDYLEGPFADWFVRHVNTRDFITAQRMSLGI